MQFAVASVVIAISWFGLQAVRADDAPALCASAEQGQQVQGFYSHPPAPPTFMAAPKLGINEAALVSALGPDRAVGTAGSGFLQVWESLRAWQDALVLVLKAGQVFEIHGRIPGGAPSTKSQFFNLVPQPAGMSGHLRPDLFAAIYAVTMDGPEGPVRGVLFFDAKGDGAFGIYVPPTADKSPSTVMPQFEATRELIRQLPRACAAP